MAAPMMNSALITNVMKLSDVDNVKRLNSSVKNHFFNKGLTVLLPGKAQLPPNILECLAEQMSYRLNGLPLYRFLEMPFIKAFMKQGNVYALTENTTLGQHDCIAVTPSGWLILHLTKDTYLELGLEAVKQTRLQKKNDIYVVKINLLANAFRPGRRGYDRVMWCLRNRLNLTFDFLMAWAPNDSSVCSSSLAVYFSDLCDGVEKVACHKSTKLLTSLPCPHVSANQPQGSDTGCTDHEMLEWMGAVACCIDIEKEDGDRDSYVSSYVCPEPCHNIPRCCLFQVSGFLTPDSISRIVQVLRDHASAHPECLPVMLTVHGFVNSPVSWKTALRDFYIPGDNLYSMLLLPDQNCWFLMAG